MCGIAGIVSFVAPPDEADVRGMVASMRHRGPDEDGFSSPDNFCSLGMCRLSIVDLAGGHQPMWDERRRYCIVFNGEIYNHAHLRELLIQRGHAFTTDHSDTETIVHGYEEWGPEVFSRMDGQFAVAIWDREERELVVARDRVGEKPLYVARAGDQWLLASEMKALLSVTTLDRDVDPEAVRQYLAFDYVVSPRTILRSVQKLSAGHIGRISADGFASEPYWTLDFKPRQLPIAAAVERLDTILERAVRSRMVADVKVGLFLSGGIDSAAVGYYMTRSSKSVEAFTIGFDQPGFDETNYARASAKALGVDHHVEILSESVVLGLIPRVVEILDEPMADPSVIPTHLLSSFARQQVKVALGGDGSDELLMGYRTYQALKVYAQLDRLPALARRSMAKAAHVLPDRGRLAKARRFGTALDLAPETRLMLRLGSFGALADQLLAHRLREELSDSSDLVPVELRSRDGAIGWAERSIATYVRGYLQEDILVKVDRASMAASLEVRAPFLAPELIEFLASIPATIKMPGLTRKALLRRVMRGRIPSEVIDRPKQGFGAPLDAWFRGPLAQLAERHLSRDAVSDAGLLDAQLVAKMLLAHKTRRADYGRQLWSMLGLQMWSSHWLGGRV